MWLLIPLLFLKILLSPEANKAPVQLEICDNALDDDGDGLVDLNDGDCTCILAAPRSRIPNPSFEDSECCPWGRSLMNCASGWIQASGATTDYLHTCGWIGWDSLPPPLPFPSGSACIGFRDGRFRNEKVPNWKEYAGACLLSPLKAGVAYKFRFYVGFTFSRNSPPIDITFFGSTNCDNLPFGLDDVNTGCPTNTEGWIKLGSKRVAGNLTWVQTDIDVRPTEDIYAIAIGPACAEKVETVDLYYFLDDLILDEFKAFNFNVSLQGNICDDNPRLSVPAFESYRYQWYKDGIALIGEKSSNLSIGREEGNYQVRIIDDEGNCRVTDPFVRRLPIYEYQVTDYGCPDEPYLFGSNTLTEPGDYVEIFRDQNGCDSVVYLDLRFVSDRVDTSRQKILAGEQLQFGPRRFQAAGNYLVNFITKNGCDSLVYLQLEHFKVFRPTAFSPNGDKVNDYFTIFGSEDIEQIQSLQVYNRWGSQVFSREKLPPDRPMEGWDGTNRGEPLPEGIYIYSAVLLMKDQKERRLQGSVLLIR